MAAPFNEFAYCDKCGSDDIVSTYQANGHNWGCRSHRPMEPDCCTFEHIDRRCGRCGFVWPELPISVRRRVS